MQARRHTRSAAVVLTLAALATSPGPAAAASAPFTNCATDSTFQVKSVDIEPSPLVPGKKATVRAEGALLQALTGGTYAADLRYMGVSVLQRSGNIGELIKLPAQPGPAALTATQKVPKKAPSGSYELLFSASDQHGTTVTCLQIPFTID